MYPSISLIKERFSQLYGLELIPENFRKRILSNLLKKINKPRFANCKDSGILQMRIDELFEPLEGLSSYLSFVPHSDATKRYLQQMFGSPFTGRLILDEYDYEDTREFHRERKRVYRLAARLVASGIFKTDSIFNDKYGLDKNSRLRDTTIYYMANYHTEEDIRKCVIWFYSMHNKVMLKSKFTPQEEAQAKVVKKVRQQAAQLEFDITPAGEKIFEAVEASKAKKTLEKKALKSQVLRVGKEQQKDFVLDKVSQAEEATKKLTTTKIKELTE